MKILSAIAQMGQRHSPAGAPGDWRTPPRVPRYRIHGASCDTLNSEELWLRAADNLRAGFDNLAKNNLATALWCFNDASLNRVQVLDTYVGRVQALSRLGRKEEARVALAQGEMLFPGRKKMRKLRRSLFE